MKHWNQRSMPWERKPSHCTSNEMQVNYYSKSVNWKEALTLDHVLFMIFVPVIKELFKLDDGNHLK